MTSTSRFYLIAWVLAAGTLIGSHISHHFAGREPSSLTLLVRLALVVVMFVVLGARRRERRAEKENAS